MERREFIASATAAAAFATVSKGWATGEDKKSRIALMMFGLSSIVKNNAAPSQTRTLDIWDIGQLAADRYGLHNVELQSFYFPSTEMSWLKDFRARLNKTKTRVVQINCEFMNEGLQVLSNSPTSVRLQMLDFHKLWFERAAFFGCPRVLVSQGALTQENKGIEISNMKALVAIAKPLNIKIVFENHGSGGDRGRAGGPGSPGGQDQRGGRSAQFPPSAPAAAPPAPAAAPAAAAPPSYVLDTEVLKAGGGYTCCDLQNFDTEKDQHDGIRVMLPYTSGLVHAGMRFDLHKALAIMRELGYKRIYSIKAQGGPSSDNPLDAAQKVLDVLLAEM
jgi:hypothetical protein